MNFKKISLYTMLAGAMTLSACEKVIDVEPEFVKDGSQIFTTLNDYDFALTGAYALFRATGYYGSGGQTTSTWANLPDMMTDNLIQTSEDLGNWSNQTNWTYTADESDIAIAWTAAYSVIAQANLVLRNLDGFATEDAARVNRIKGQALAIRGMAHFDVLRYWGQNYGRNSTALGIPYVDQVNIENKPSRLSVKESWDRILADMLQAETLLGNVDRAVNTTNNKGGMDRNAVRGLLARMYLYAEEWDKAEDYATLVINAVPLASATTFPSIWKDASQAEVLFAVSFSAGEGSPSSGAHNAPSNRNRFRPSNDLLGLYNLTSDVRVPSYYGTRNLSGNPRNILTKFYGRGTAADNLVNWKVIRSAEMYLIRAEAYARSGQETQALSDLNTLRAARISSYVPVVALTGADLLDAIAIERRRELAGEGHRWFDLKRTTRVVTRTDCGSARDCALEATNRAWVWPIPQGEIDANENIRGQQSPGY